MRSQIYCFIFLQLICDYCNFCRGNPLIGETVRQAKIGEFPFIVSISTKNYDPNLAHFEKDHFCGGSLITTKHVLTAAHCIQNTDKLNRLVVKVGSRDLRSTKIKKYDVKNFITYGKWMSENNRLQEYPENDVAVLKLSGKVNLKFITAVITNSHTKDFYGRTVETAGWGVRENGREPRYMRATSLHVITNEECVRNAMIHKSSRTQHIFEAVHLCTVSDPPVTLTCGDSGSPLLINKNEIIAVNHGTCYPKRKNENTPGYQNVHVSIEIYKEFIRNVTTTCKKSSFWCWDANDD